MVNGSVFATSYIVGLYKPHMHFVSNKRHWRCTL